MKVLVQHPTNSRLDFELKSGAIPRIGEEVSVPGGAENLVVFKVVHSFDGETVYVYLIHK